MGLDPRSDLGEMQHAGAEGRGGTDEGLNKATCQLESVGDVPHVCLIQQRIKHQSQVQSVHHCRVYTLKHTDTHFFLIEEKKILSCYLISF